MVSICPGTAAHLSAESTDPTKTDPSHQGRAPCAIPALLDLHFNSQKARRHMRLFGRTLQLDHAHGIRLLPLPIRHIRNTSSRTATATGKGSPPSSGQIVVFAHERKSIGPIHYDQEWWEICHYQLVPIYGC